MTTVSTSLIQPLTPDDAHRVRLPWSSPFDTASLAAHLAAHPGRSLWIPQTGEYVIGEPWRHRQAITSIVDIAVRDHGRALVQALADSELTVRHDLVVMTDFANTRRPGSYNDLGLQLIQEVYCYDLPGIPREAPLGTLQFTPINLSDPNDRAALLGVDHQAFPWLWWNTADEFASYMDAPGVVVYLGRDVSGRIVAYFGITHYRDWGHLDRIGVVPEAQGRGFGLESLRCVVSLLAGAGATRIGLSTQATNTRSQHLYQRFGFRRTYQNDYVIYGHWVNAERERTAFATEQSGERGEHA